MWDLLYFEYDNQYNQYAVKQIVKADGGSFDSETEVFELLKSVELDPSIRIKNLMLLSAVEKSSNNIGKCLAVDERGFSVPVIVSAYSTLGEALKVLREDTIPDKDGIVMCKAYREVRLMPIVENDFVGWMVIQFFNTDVVQGWKTNGSTD